MSDRGMVRLTTHDKLDRVGSAVGKLPYNKMNCNISKLWVVGLSFFNPTVLDLMADRVTNSKYLGT